MISWSIQVPNYGNGKVGASDRSLMRYLANLSYGFSILPGISGKLPPTQNH
ncbi:hypothetical protein [Anabaena sp. CCY 9614]|uniref:hypothetical protein n=1 Tax=Anabaena sp. CCY 9614 TaxID=3103869 RepID=UPI0039C6B55C